MTSLLTLSSGVRIAGLSIGHYDGEWDKLFNPVINNLKKFKKFLLVTDGDASILKALQGKVMVKFQRCLWHIPHQMKYYLWKDGVKRKSEEWFYILAELLSICSVKAVQDNERKEIIEKVAASKEKQLEELITYCQDRTWQTCVSYLSNAKPDMFTSLKNRLGGKTTSKVERVMKTINYRINVGKWSPEGALNANKIRLAYYYNDFDA